MHKANRPIVGDGLGTLLLWKEHNVFLVESIEVFRVVVGHSAMLQPPVEKLYCGQPREWAYRAKKILNFFFEWERI
jgi:hypothetical protein